MLAILQQWSKLYNARYAYRIRDSNTETKQLMKLLELDQYIHWHRLKDENVVRVIFGSHPDAVKLTNASNLVFLIDSTYKTSRYMMSLLDIVGVTPTAMTFSATCVYFEGERLNNVVWTLEWFWGIFLRRDTIPGVIVIDRDLTLMNAVNFFFPESTNLLCRFHINKNMKAKCKTLVGKKNAWDYVMEAWKSLVDCPTEIEYDDCLMKFEIVWSSWPMFVDYVKQTWLIPHRQRFVKAWMTKVMHLGNTTTNRYQNCKCILVLIRTH